MHLWRERQKRNLKLWFMRLWFSDSCWLEFCHLMGITGWALVMIYEQLRASPYPAYSLLMDISGSPWPWAVLCAAIVAAHWIAQMGSLPLMRIGALAASTGYFVSVGLLLTFRNGITTGTTTYLLALGLTGVLATSRLIIHHRLRRVSDDA